MTKIDKNSPADRFDKWLMETFKKLPNKEQIRLMDGYKEIIIRIERRIGDDYKCSYCGKINRILVKNNRD